MSVIMSDTYRYLCYKCFLPFNEFNMVFMKQKGKKLSVKTHECLRCESNVYLRIGNNRKESDNA